MEAVVGLLGATSDCPRRKKVNLRLARFVSSCAGSLRLRNKRVMLRLL